MLTKITKILTETITSAARDIRLVSLIVLGVLALLTTWNGIQLIEINYKLQQEIAKLETKNNITKLENDNLRLETEYLKTDTYLELVARQQFGKGEKGETLILIPKEVALSHAPQLSNDEIDQHIASDETPQYLQNLRAWRDFYFPSQSL